MIKYYQQGTVWHNGAPQNAAQDADKCAGRNGTIAYQILNAHRAQSDDGIFHISFDALVSHDITYVGIIQTARASGLTEFPIPYAMTNCHNSLCAVGGTINEDDHVFGLSAARKYGSMTSILADSVNEKLFDTFGDTVIDFSSDAPELIDDYTEELKSMFPL